MAPNESLVGEYGWLDTSDWLEVSLAGKKLRRAIIWAGSHAA